MGRGVLWLMGIAFLVLGAAGLGGSGSLAQEPLRKKALEVLVPLRSEEPPPPGSTLGQRVALGRMLFFEPRASVDGTVSCSRCHLPQLYGTDGLARSIGVMGERTREMLPRFSMRFSSSPSIGGAIGSPWRIKLRRH
jgi:cytochrome c peroxidase